jgi:hypothetical protein
MTTAFRSFPSAAKRVRIKDAVRNYRQLRQQQDIRNVAPYNEYIEILRSLHKYGAEQINWNEIKKMPPPLEEVAENKKEKLARQRLLSYSPSFFDKLFNNKERRIRELTSALEQAIIFDKADHEKYLQEYQSAVYDWQRLQKIAEGVLAKNPVAYEEVIEYFEPFNEIKELGAAIVLHFEPTYITIDLTIDTVDIIPAYNLMQTSTGKLSKKEMPLSKFNELYQDYVCSSILRLAREAYAYLPIDLVYIHVMSQDVTIVSVAIPMNALNRLKFESVDPADSMRNFEHHMRFSKSGGFSAVEPVLHSI